MPAASLLVYTDGEVIGDGIIRLAFAAALKRAVPGLHLSWLSAGYSVYETVLADMARPLIDELIVMPERKRPLSDYLLRPAPLRHHRFDSILDTQRSTKHTLWLKRVRHRRFISAAANGLFCSLPLPALSAHFFTRLMQLGELAIGQPLVDAPLALPQGPWQPEAVRLLPDGQRYVGFIVGAGHPDKCWPLENFIALAQQCSARNFVPVFFLGPLETEQRSAIETALPQAILPLQAAAPSLATPYLTIALGQRLTAAVANDSGGGHLLAAADTKLVSLFRAASVRTKFLPRGTQVTALAPEDFGVATMKEIPGEVVARALQSLLK